MSNFFSLQNSVYVPSRVKAELLKNMDLCKLLYYNTPDALSQPDLTSEQKKQLSENRVVQIGDEEKYKHPIISSKSFLDEIIEDSSARLKIYIGSFKQTQETGNKLNNYIVFAEVWIEVIVGNADEILLLQDNTTRDLRLVLETVGQLNGKNVGGVGTFHFPQVREKIFGEKVKWGNNLTGYLIKGVVPIG